MSKCGWVGAQLEAFESERETTRVQFILYRVSFMGFGQFFQLKQFAELKIWFCLLNINFAD